MSMLMRAHLLIYTTALNNSMLHEIQEACRASNVMGYITVLLEHPSRNQLRLHPIQVTNVENTVHVFGTVVKNNDPASVHNDAETKHATSLLRDRILFIIDNGY